MGDTAIEAVLTVQITLSVWTGTVLQVETAPVPRLMLKRSDGAIRAVLLPKVHMITDEKKRKEAGPPRTYLLGELKDKPVTVRLLKGERPALNGTRTAAQITVNAAAGASPEPRDPEEAAPAKPEVEPR